MRKAIFAAAAAAVALASPASAQMVEKERVGNWTIYQHQGVCSMSRSYGHYYHAVAGPFDTSISFGFGSTDLTGVSKQGTQSLQLTADGKNWGTADANGMVSSNGLMSGYNFLIDGSVVGKKLPKSLKVVRGSEVIQTLDFADAGPAYTALLNCSSNAKGQ